MTEPLLPPRISLVKYDEPSSPRIDRTGVVIKVIGGLILAGAVVGLLWAFLAPPVHGAIALTREGDRVQVFLGNDGDQYFVGAALLVGMLFVLAVVSAVLLWRWKAHRGPVMVAAATAGSIAAAAAAAGVGALVGRLRYGVVDIATAPVTPDDRIYYVTQAPGVFFAHTPLVVMATLLAGAGVWALVYVLFVATTERDDLGSYPPVDPRPYPLPPQPPQQVATAADA